MEKFIIITIAAIMTYNAQAQDNLPYYEIPEYPESYTAGTVAARMVDGLGFRFYWATEGLTRADLAYRPGEMTRSSEETIDHIYRLAKIIFFTAKQRPFEGSDEVDTMSFEEKRRKILENLKSASDVFMTITDLENYTLQFKNQTGDITEYPFWHHLNGPIADALWHTGQIVSFRRSSGNPFPSKVSVFTGTVKNQ